ncbi:hypothetical protein CDAR_458651 [Caerostris darwini]|uniref:Uncharacterized protein n=1 Tax=Caerostris darwini TaxID=1538125 RepID=A0AAV4VCR1_9ARAC|nr:hypothetical protein CDAR_458651 [Caerostris darwini]
MDENRSRIFQYLEQITEEIENTIVLASNVFYYLQQAVYVYIMLEPEILTADECRAREQESTILINRLQEFRTINGIVRDDSVRSKELLSFHFIG